MGNLGCSCLRLDIPYVYCSPVSKCGSRGYLRTLEGPNSGHEEIFRNSTRWKLNENKGDNLIFVMFSSLI